MKSKISILLSFILSSHLTLANDFKVQKIPLSFRPGNRAGALAHVSIKGQTFLFLVDTGASGHSLNYGIVQKLKLSQGNIGISADRSPLDLDRLA